MNGWTLKGLKAELTGITTGLYGSLLSCTALYGSLLLCTGLYGSLLVSTGLHWSLTNLSGVVAGGRGGLLREMRLRSVCPHCHVLLSERTQLTSCTYGDEDRAMETGEWRRRLCLKPCPSFIKGSHRIPVLIYDPVLKQTVFLSHLSHWWSIKMFYCDGIFPVLLIKWC